jgi:hypothetical protein
MAISDPTAAVRAEACRHRTSAVEDFKINGQYVDTPDASTADYPNGVVGIPFFDGYVEQASLDYLDKAAQSDTPFFMCINLPTGDSCEASLSS